MVARTRRRRRALAVSLLLATRLQRRRRHDDDDRPSGVERSDRRRARRRPRRARRHRRRPHRRRRRSATTSTLPVDTGELGVLDAALAPDGTIDLDAALALVAAGYGPLPGVTPAAAPLVDGGPGAAHRRRRRRRPHAGAADRGRRHHRPARHAARHRGDRGEPRVTATAASVATSSLATFGWTADAGADRDPRAAVRQRGRHAQLLVARARWRRRWSCGDERARRVPHPRRHRRACRRDPTFIAAVARETYHCGQYAARSAPAGRPGLGRRGRRRVRRRPGRRCQRADDRPAWQRWVGAAAAAAARAHVRRDRVLRPRRRAPPTRSRSPPRCSATRASTASAGASSSTDLFDRWGRQYATRPDWEGGFAFTAPGAAGLDAPRTPVTLTVDGPAVVLGGGEDLSAIAVRDHGPGRRARRDDGTGRPRRDPLRPTGRPTSLAQATQSVCLLPERLRLPGRGGRRAQRRRRRRARRVRRRSARRRATGPTLAARSLPAGARRSPSRRPPTPSTRASSARGGRRRTSRPRRPGWCRR